MAVMAKWRDMRFEVSPTQIKALQDLSWSYEQISEVSEDAEGTPKTNQRGIKLLQISGSVLLHAGAGVDVRKEIERWRERVTKAGYLYLAGKPLGPIMQLTKVGVGSVQTDDAGRLLLATLSLSWQEYDRASTTVVDNSAYALGASPDEKEEKKTENRGLSGATEVKLGVGSRVKITGTSYAGGGKIPESVKDAVHEVSRISGEKALLGWPDGICSWVYTHDLTLV